MDPRLLERRLPWLLVFRAIVAALLFVFTIAADIFDWPVARISVVLYGVAFGSFVVILGLALMLRARYAPLVVASGHLVAALMVAVMVVQATGAVSSVFSFLFILVVLDAAILGGRSTALAAASVASLTYGGLMAVQLYELFTPTTTPASVFASSVVAHVSAFYMMALLAGHLADQLSVATTSATRAREDLERVEKLQAAIAASLPVGLITLDTRARVHTCNAMAGEILGLEEKVLLGDMLGSRLKLPNVGEAIEVTHRHKRLLVRRVPVTAVPGSVDTQTTLLDAESDADHIPGHALELVLLEDRTHFYEMEKVLRARDRLASIGELAASIAHEIRNPLAAISGAAELLAATPGTESTENRLQNIILREIDRLDTLVNNFLLYARPTPPKRVPTTVSRLINELREAVEGEDLWQLRPLKTEVAELPSASIDEIQVHRLLMNLLRNAAEASPPGSSVVLSAVAEGTDLVFSVRDDGEGIDPEIREHIFEPFRSTRRGGHGLGLAVVYRLAEGHDAEIEVDSTPGAGTTMRVVFPKALQERPPRAAREQ